MECRIERQWSAERRHKGKEASSVGQRCSGHKSTALMKLKSVWTYLQWWLITAS